MSAAALRNLRWNKSGLILPGSGGGVQAAAGTMSAGRAGYLRRPRPRRLGLGVTVYPACIENNFRRGLSFRPIRDIDTTIDTLMVWDPDRIAPAAMTFREAAIT